MSLTMEYKKHAATQLTKRRPGAMRMWRRYFLTGLDIPAGNPVKGRATRLPGFGKGVHIGDSWQKKPGVVFMG